jgi:membrane fusion protein (multidrug efflux system)
MASNDSGSADPRASQLRAAVSGRGKLLAIAIAALLLAAWGIHWVYERFHHVYLDDARVDGEVVTISSRVSGWITELPVIEGDAVKKGQLLAKVDDRDMVLQREVLVARLKAMENQAGVVVGADRPGRPGNEGQVRQRGQPVEGGRGGGRVPDGAAQAGKGRFSAGERAGRREVAVSQAMERARSTYHQTEESLRKAQSDYAAVRGTVAAAGGSRRQLQVLDRQRTVLGHQVDEIRAEVRRRDVDIADRTILSPADGRVVMTFVRQGEHVSPGQRILMFHDPKAIWVEANVKETDVRLLKPGMKAEVHVDAYPGRVFAGEVFRIGQTATSKFALLPDPNPSGNFTKITQRLPVRIVLTEKDPALRPGMMVEVSIPVRND